MFGWLKCKLFLQNDDYLQQSCVVCDMQVYIVDCYKKLSHQIFLVKLIGIDDRGGAILLKGSDVVINRQLFLHLEHNEYYLVDLVGFTVVNNMQFSFGRVVDFMVDTGEVPVMVVSKKRVLIPFHKDYILDVEQERERILVNWQKDF